MIQPYNSYFQYVHKNMNKIREQKITRLSMRPDGKNKLLNGLEEIRKRKPGWQHHTDCACSMLYTIHPQCFEARHIHMLKAQSIALQIQAAPGRAVSQVVQARRLWSALTTQQLHVSHLSSFFLQCI